MISGLERFRDDLCEDIGKEDVITIRCDKDLSPGKSSQILMSSLKDKGIQFEFKSFDFETDGIKHLLDFEESLLGFTRIKVSKKLTNELKDIGDKGETYEDVIWRLIKNSEYCSKEVAQLRERQRKWNNG